MKPIKLIDTKNLPHDKWLEYRRKGIGGSDAGAIIGLNKWSTPYSVWADKTGQVPFSDFDNEAMRLGRDLEEYVASRFEEASGLKVRRRNAILQHPEHTFMLANIDREVVGEKAGLECKTAKSYNLKNFKNGEFPANYYAQCVHYMAVTGYDRWYLAVLVFGEDFKIFKLERDEDEISALIEAEGSFWNDYVLKNTPPPVDGETPTTDTLKAIYAESNDKGIEIVGRDSLIDSRFKLKEDIKEIEKEIELIDQTLMSELGDCELGISENYKITWKSQTRSTLDKKALAKALPDINLDEYSKVSTSRVFGISKLKKEAV